MSPNLALCCSLRHMLREFARRSAHWRVPNLLACDQAAFHRLPERLSNEVPIDRAGLDQVENSA